MSTPSAGATSTADAFARNRASSAPVQLDGGVAASAASSVVVKNDAGQPIADADVVVWPEANPNKRTPLKTAADGSLQLPTDIPDGTNVMLKIMPAPAAAAAGGQP